MMMDIHSTIDNISNDELAYFLGEVKSDNCSSVN